MEASVDLSKSEVLENAIEQFRQKHPEHTFRIDTMKEQLIKVGQFLLQIWENVKKFFSNLTKNMSNDSLQKFLEKIKNLKEEQIRPLKYKEGLHQFLETKSIQRHNMMSHSNIYHNSGRQFKNYSRGKR